MGVGFSRTGAGFGVRSGVASEAGWAAGAGVTTGAGAASTAADAGVDCTTTGAGLGDSSGFTAINTIPDAITAPAPNAIRILEFTYTPSPIIKRARLPFRFLGRTVKMVSRWHSRLNSRSAP